jgi:hypothetical protein
VTYERSYLWAFDPGRTTGFALFIRHQLTRQKWTLARWGSFSHDDSSIFHQIIISDRVIYEQVTSRTSAFDSVGIEVIGVIKHFCRSVNVVPYSQSPSVLNGARKWPISHEIQQVMQKKDYSIHAWEAAMHGVVFLGPTNVVAQNPR